MKKILLHIIGFGLMTLVASSCAEKFEPKPLTYSQLLTGETKKSWQFSSIIIVDNGIADSPIQARNLIDACWADDYYTFYANDEKKFEISEGPSKCDPRDPDIYLTDDWTLVNATATIEFAFPVLTDQKIPYVIKSLTANTLVMEYYDQDYKISYRMTFTSTTTK
jgi:Lipocalin-like domain